MKKLISIVLCAVMLLSSALVPVGATEEQPYFELVGEEVYIPANKILKSAYNLEGETNYEYYVLLEDSTDSNNTTEIRFYDCFTQDKLVDVDDCDYVIYKGYRSNRSSNNEKVNFNDGAYYQKVRVKVCEVYSEYYYAKYIDGEYVYETRGYFKENGDYYFYHYEKGEFLYDFTNTEKVQESGMYVISGNAITAVKPDENGMIEFYIKKGLKKGIPYLLGKATQFIGISQFSVSFGDEMKLGIGNVNLDTNVNVTDATLIQKYCAELEGLNEMQMYFADVNGDGAVNVIDSTLIQKYCVGI